MIAPVLGSQALLHEMWMGFLEPGFSLATPAGCRHGGDPVTRSTLLFLSVYLSNKLLEVFESQKIQQRFLQ